MKTSITFEQPGDFDASRAAEKWLQKHGFSFGPSQADGPQAIWFGDCSISKWRNLSAAERKSADAVLHSGRGCAATITLMPSASPAARAAFEAALAETNTEGGSCD